MSNWDVYNQVLLLLNENSSRFITVNDGYDAVCQQLQVDDLILSIIREDPGMWAPSPTPTKYIMYAIHPNGIKLIATLPTEYNGKPYDHFLKLKQNALDAEATFKELINKASKSTIRTSNWTLWLFIATTVMAVATLVLAIYPFTIKSSVNRDLQQIQERLQRLEDRALSHNQTTTPAGPLVKPQTKSAPVSAIDSAKK